ncbi:unnamed protein product [Amoebophrya sp. A120]|nr:unnamed protein product [Amoebophrya sp. A120]|eukprot:GSA120T00014498001.1
MQVLPSFLGGKTSFSPEEQQARQRVIHFFCPYRTPLNPRRMSSVGDDDGIAHSHSRRRAPPYAFLIAPQDVERSIQLLNQGIMAARGLMPAGGWVPQQQVATTSPVQQLPPPEDPTDLQQRLAALKKMCDDGHITQEDYQNGKLHKDLFHLFTGK